MGVATTRASQAQAYPDIFMIYFYYHDIDILEIFDNLMIFAYFHDV